jgi:hypothetical protein
MIDSPGVDLTRSTPSSEAHTHLLRTSTRGQWSLEGPRHPRLLETVELRTWPWRAGCGWIHHYAAPGQVCRQQKQLVSSVLSTVLQIFQNAALFSFVRRLRDVTESEYLGTAGKQLLEEPLLESRACCASVQCCMLPLYGAVKSKSKKPA